MQLDSGTLFVPNLKAVDEIDVVVPCHNRIEQTIPCVETLYENTTAKFHLIVVDDSTDKMTPIFWKEQQKKHDNITYLHPKIDYKEGNEYLNVAFTRAKTQYVACIGNSIRVEPEWEVVALNLFKDDPGIGIVGFKNLFGVPQMGITGTIESAGITMAGYTPVDIGRDLYSHRQSSIYECPAVQWAFCMVRKEAVCDKNGVPNLPTGVYNGFKGWDDIDNCLVLRNRGWKVVYDGYGVGYHHPRATRATMTDEGHDQNRQNARVFYKRWGYWDAFIRDYPKAPDGKDWPECVDGVVQMP